MVSGLQNQVQIQWLANPSVQSSALAISDDLLICRSVHRVRAAANQPRVQLGEFTLAFAQRTLQVHTLHGGGASSGALRPPADLILRPGKDWFRYGQHGHFVCALDVADHAELTSLFVTQAGLHALLGLEATRQLLRSLGLEPAGVAQQAALPQHVMQPLHQCLSCDSVGALHTLYAQSKILEFLWKLATHAPLVKSARRASTRELENLRALHAHLTQLEGAMPTLKALAQQFGGTPQSLNRDFLREYGQSIYAMVSSHRLNLAHQALLDGGVPIKTLAKRLGYSHANHFSYAFKKKFGYTPGSVRRAP